VIIYWCFFWILGRNGDHFFDFFLFSVHHTSLNKNQNSTKTILFSVNFYRDFGAVRADIFRGNWKNERKKNSKVWGLKNWQKFQRFSKNDFVRKIYFCKKRKNCSVHAEPTKTRPYGGSLYGCRWNFCILGAGSVIFLQSNWWMPGAK